MRGKARDTGKTHRDRCKIVGRKAKQSKARRSEHTKSEASWGRPRLAIVAPKGHDEGLRIGSLPGRHTAAIRTKIISPASACSSSANGLLEDSDILHSRGASRSRVLPAAVAAACSSCTFPFLSPYAISLLAFSFLLAVTIARTGRSPVMLSHAPGLAWV